MKKSALLIPLFILTFAAASSGTAFAKKDKFKIPFFDGIKYQISNSNPKLTNANHMIEDINTLTGARLRDWDSIHIFTFDIVLWKDLSKYFKTDFAISGTTGSLVSSSKALPGTPLETGIRMRQRYSDLMFWTNLYFYPFTTNYKDKYKSGHVVEPFLAVGLGYTLFRSESVFKIRKKNMLYTRVKNNWYGGDWGFKIMTGFNINPENISPKLKGWVITFSAFYIWNRLKGHSNMHLTDGLKIGGREVKLDIQAENRMDIDITGPCLSLAIGHYF